MKTRDIFFTMSAAIACLYPFSSMADTILNYEFNKSDAAYLNICSLTYRLNTGRCSKINLMNTKVNGKVGTITVDNNHLGEGSKAWAVFVVDINNSPYRYLYFNEITGGGAYNFGPDYNNMTSK